MKDVYFESIIINHFLKELHGDPKKCLVGAYGSIWTNEDTIKLTKFYISFFSLMIIVE